MWLDESTINPVVLGWKLNDNTTFCSMMIRLPPSPTNLLKIIHCNSLCDSERDPNCTTTCGNCQKTNCSNGAREVDVNDHDDDDDYDV